MHSHLEVGTLHLVQAASRSRFGFLVIMKAPRCRSNCVFRLARFHDTQCVGTVLYQVDCCVMGLPQVHHAEGDEQLYWARVCEMPAGRSPRAAV